MSNEIKLAKSNTDSGRMTDSTLRQRFDERTQLKKQRPDDVLRDSAVDVINNVETADQRQISMVVVSESHEAPQVPNYRVSPLDDSRESPPKADSYYPTPFSSFNFDIPQSQQKQEDDNGSIHSNEQPFKDKGSQSVNMPVDLRQKRDRWRLGDPRIENYAFNEQSANPYHPPYQEEQSRTDNPAVSDNDGSSFYKATFDTVSSLQSAHQGRGSETSRQQENRSESTSAPSSCYGIESIAERQRPSDSYTPIPFVPAVPVDPDIPSIPWQDSLDRAECGKSPIWANETSRHPKGSSFPVDSASYFARQENPSNSSSNRQQAEKQPPYSLEQTERFAPAIFSAEFHGQPGRTPTRSLESGRGTTSRSKQAGAQSSDIPVKLAQKKCGFEKLLNNQPECEEPVKAVEVHLDDAALTETEVGAAYIALVEQKSSVPEKPEKKSSALAEQAGHGAATRSNQIGDQTSKTLIRLAQKKSGSAKVLNNQSEHRESVKSAAAHLDDAALTETEVGAAYIALVEQKSSVPEKPEKKSSALVEQAGHGAGTRSNQICDQTSKTLIRLAQKKSGSAKVLHNQSEHRESVKPVAAHLDDAALTEAEIEASYIALVEQESSIPEKPEKRLPARSEQSDDLPSDTLVIGVRQKSRTDRILKDNPEHKIDPDAALKHPEELDADALLGAGRSEKRARTAVSSASRLLRKQGQLLLKTGAKAAASATITSQITERSEGSDADAQKVIQRYGNGVKSARSLARRVSRLKRRQTEKRAAQAGRAAGRAASSSTKKAAEQGGRKLVTSAIGAIKEVLVSIVSVVGGVAVPALIAILSILLVIVLFMSIFTSIAGSPYGIFFVHEQQQELEFDAAVGRITNSYYNKIYEKEMSNDYETVEVNCEITDSEQIWKEIVAVYAVDVCKEGLDAMTMDAEHYAILKDVFWQKISVSFQTTSWTERVETVVQEAYSYDVTTADPDTGAIIVTTVNVPAEVEVTYVVHRTLHVTVSAQTLDQLKSHYRFTDGERDTVDDLLAESDDLWSSLTPDFTNLVVSSGGGITGAVDITAYATVAETVYRALIEHGYSVQAACGILGNIQQESSFNPNSGSSFYGLCQWGGERLNRLKSLSGWQTASVQTGFMISELDSQTGIWSTYGGAMNYTYSGVRITSLSSFQSCTNVKAAAGAFCVCYERSGEYPGDEGYDNRLSYANSWYSYAQVHWNH